MSILNDIDKVRQGATKKTKNVSETIRLSGLIKEEEKLQNVLLKEIGDYVYLHKESFDELAIKDIIAKIDESKGKANWYREQINYIKSVVICKNCKQEMPAEMIYCTQCGGKLKEDPRHSESAMICKNCGTEIKDGQKFCVKCGMKVQVIEQPEIVVVEKCIQCGADIQPGNVFCPKCGTKLK